jgi:hypothetical protein
MLFCRHAVAWAAIQAIPPLKQVYEEDAALLEKMSGDDIWNLCVRNLRLIPPEWQKALFQAQKAEVYEAQKALGTQKGG